jgi:hypothetical protein
MSNHDWLGFGARKPATNKKKKMNWSWWVDSVTGFLTLTFAQSAPQEHGRVDKTP